MDDERSPVSGFPGSDSVRISRTQVEAVLRSYLDKVNKLNTTSSSSVNKPNDQVSVSDDARRVSKWVELAREIPDVRPDELQRLRSAMARGNYAPGNEEIAEKILQRLLTDRLLEEE